jgi:hypothetical protein
MKVYCDTSTLLSNIKRHDDAKTLKELAALERLLALRWQRKIEMVRSRVVLRELERTHSEQLVKLRADYEALDQVPLDERVLGFHDQFDRFGGVSYPLVSDVQDDDLRDELVRRGLVEKKKGREDRSDAEHLTQAKANGCDVFLTRDDHSILKHREWLEHKLTGLKIRRPSELLSELEP